MGAGLDTDYTDLSDVFAAKLGLIHVESTDEAIPGNPPGTAPARLFVRRYEETLDDPAAAPEPDALGEPSERERRLNVYELHWWPLGQNRKSRLLADERYYPGKRAFLNRSLKRSLINERLADPIIYLSPDLGPAIRESVSYTLCRAAGGTWSPATCLGVEQMSPTIILTESLGSEIVFRVLTEPSSLGSSEAIKLSTTTIFMLANQVPLLRLAAPSTGAASDDPIRRFAAQWTDERYKQRRQIVAVSDPSDLLSYPIPESITVPGVSFINVTCSLGSRYALGAVVNPLGAHTMAKRDERIIDLIAFGTEYAPHRHQRTPRYRFKGRRSG
jgi:hypothetical protein